MEFTSTIKRDIRVHDVGSAVVHMSAEGVKITVPGVRGAFVETTWEKILEGSATPMKAPSFLYGRPVEYLKHFIQKRERTQAVL